MSADNAPVEPTDLDLQEIVDQVWQSYLDPDGLAPLVPTGVADGPLDAHASVSITGPWHGHVVFACTGAAARAAAAALLAAEPEELSDDDIADSLGELANIVGGNVKGMLPGGCLLALPHVVTGPAAAVHWPGATRICDIAGQWRGESVSISVWHEKREG